MAIIVTGGAGYIGSHFVQTLISNNYEVVVLDNLSRGHIESVPKNAKFENVDLMDYDKLFSVLKNHKIEAIVHFAAFAYVGESVENPTLYYRNNVVGSYNLLKATVEANINNFIFSSTCSLYGNPLKVPITEDEPIKPINPYAKTKYIIEMMLEDLSFSHGLKYTALRYFNAAGASLDSSIGESHQPEPHLIPLILFTALGKRDKIMIFGDDYDTPDGTCIRDYIHVSDLADAHLKAIEYLRNGGKSDIFNLGTGNGYSVKEMIVSAEKITGKNINSAVTERRAGDPAILVAGNKKAKDTLNWNPKYNLDDIIHSAWNWHLNQKY